MQQQQQTQQIQQMQQQQQQQQQMQQQPMQQQQMQQQQMQQQQMQQQKAPAAMPASYFQRQIHRPAPLDITMCTAAAETNREPRIIPHTMDFSSISSSTSGSRHNSLLNPLPSSLTQHHTENSHSDVSHSEAFVVLF